MPEPPFPRISAPSLVLALTLLILCVVMMVIQSWAFAMPVGLRVHLIRPGIVARTSGGIQPLRVRVAFAGLRQPPVLWVDSEPVPWDGFVARLRRELNCRPQDWPIYVEGDRDLEWRSVAETIDRIQGQGAQVVLLPRAQTIK